MKPIATIVSHFLLLAGLFGASACFRPAELLGDETDRAYYASGIASAKWNGPVGGASEAVSGSGLTENRHGASIAGNWMQPGSGGGDAAWFVVDLQGRCDPAKLVLWNYFEFGGNPEQNKTLPNRGIASADIYIATAGSGAKIPAGSGGPFDFAAAGWKRIHAGHAFHIAPVARDAADTAGPTDTIDLTGHAGVTHVALAGMKHFAPDAFGQYTGFSEVRIVPVAGTYVEDPNSPRARLRATVKREANFDKLVFLRRYTYQSSHIYTDHYDGSTLAGGNLCILSPVAPDGKVTELVPTLSDGIIGNYDLSYDARRVVFSYKPAPDLGYRIFEVGIDGRGLRQLTHDGPDEPLMHARYGHGYDDLDPCYLPNGRIVFTSTRAKRAVLCTPNFTSTSLHVMDADGSNIHAISGNTINEFTPTMMHDGRVLYTRWEYVDKGAGDVQSLWAVRPDGSGGAHVYKNNLSLPSAMMDARQIPGSNKIVAIGAPHMPLAVGSVLVVDIRVSQQHASAMTSLTPAIGWPSHYGWPNPGAGFYANPYPLSEDLFLVSFCPGPTHNNPSGYAIHYFDGSGTRQLLYRDDKYSCFRPMPLRPRPVPPMIPTTDQLASAPSGDPSEVEAEESATLFLEDVYAGMTGIERGRVKYLRVMEDVPKPWAPSWVSPGCGDSIGMQHPAVSLDGHFAVKRIHGIVPVHEDGSALFVVPAGKNLYFQALDEDYMELQRMRTFVNLMPGETRSCVGCHESRQTAALPRSALPSALRNDPLALAPQPGDTAGPRTVHYPIDVQPVLDRHCVSCHGPAEPAAGLDLSGELTTLFNRSYENLIRRNLVNKVDVSPRDNYIPAVRPLTFGSHRSKLIEQIRRADSPCNTGMTREEFARVVTWIDANAPYYGIYQGKRNLKWQNATDFRPDPLAATQSRPPLRLAPPSGLPPRGDD